MSHRFEFDKDPDAVLDYTFDWAGQGYLEDGEIITNAQFLLEDGIGNGGDSFTDTTTTVWLTGGSNGITYDVTHRITTNQLRTDDRTMQINVFHR